MDVRERRRSALLTHAQGEVVWIYGSLCRPGKFNEFSDGDVAFEALPEGISMGYMQSLLSRDTGVEVDVCLLGQTRLEEVIRKHGEKWTL